MNVIVYMGQGALLPIGLLGECYSSVTRLYRRTTAAFLLLCRLIDNRYDIDMAAAVRSVHKMVCIARSLFQLWHLPERLLPAVGTKRSNAVVTAIMHMCHM
jgi:hypothetical protein